jgi:hypothetical protein
MLGQQPEIGPGAILEPTDHTIARLRPQLIPEADAQLAPRQRRDDILRCEIPGLTAEVLRAQRHGHAPGQSRECVSGVDREIAQRAHRLHVLREPAGEFEAGQEADVQEPVLAVFARPGLVAARADARGALVLDLGGRDRQQAGRAGQ